MNPTSRTKALLPLNPLEKVTVERHQISPHGLIPNTSIQRKPLIIYHGIITHELLPTLTAAQIEAHINAVGECKPMWRYPMYREDHFHTTAHEVLVIWRGRATLNFGGRGCTDAVEVTLGRGDAILIPAGVSHALLEDLHAQDGAFEMVGSYQVGSEHWDMCYGRAGEEGHVEHIKDVAWFARDPLYGERGPAVTL